MDILATPSRDELRQVEGGAWWHRVIAVFSICWDWCDGDYECAETCTDYVLDAPEDA